MDAFYGRSGLLIGRSGRDMFLRNRLLRVSHAIQEVIVVNEPQGLNGERRGDVGVVYLEQVIAILFFAARRARAHSKHRPAIWT